MTQVTDQPSGLYYCCCMYICTTWLVVQLLLSNQMCFKGSAIKWAIVSFVAHMFLCTWKVATSFSCRYGDEVCWDCQATWGTGTAQERTGDGTSHTTPAWGRGEEGGREKGKRGPHCPEEGGEEGCKTGEAANWVTVRDKYKSNIVLFPDPFFLVTLSWRKWSGTSYSGQETIYTVKIFGLL